MTPTLSQLVDRAAIWTTLCRYAQGLDQRQWDVFRDAFAADAIVEVPGYLDGPMPATSFVDFLAGAFDDVRLSGQHVLANTLYEIDGDRARTVTEFLATNVERTDVADQVSVQVAGGVYVDRFARDETGWRIVHHVITRKNDERRTVAYSPDALAAVAGSASNDAVSGL